jgi:hypothetical protein
MDITPFFRQLRSAYQAELDDLTFDSEGRDVLKKRLAAKRREISFLVQMMELSPEMVAVVLHQAFRFKHSGVLGQVLGHEGDDLPDWDEIAPAVEVQPWAQELVATFLQQPKGAWFLTLSAALEYMHSHPQLRGGSDADHEADTEDADGEHQGHGHAHNQDDRHPDDDDGRDDAPSLDEAGADWLADQGFDRKD